MRESVFTLVLLLMLAPFGCQDEPLPPPPPQRVEEVKLEEPEPLQREGVNHGRDSILVAHEDPILGMPYPKKGRVIISNEKEAVVEVKAPLMELKRFVRKHFVEHKISHNPAGFEVLPIEPRMGEVAVKVIAIKARGRTIYQLRYRLLPPQTQEERDTLPKLPTAEPAIG